MSKEGWCKHGQFSLLINRGSDCDIGYSKYWFKEADDTIGYPFRDSNKKTKFRIQGGREVSEIRLGPPEARGRDAVFRTSGWVDYKRGITDSNL